MKKTKAALAEWGTAGVLALAVMGCFAAMALGEEKPVYPELQLESQGLVRAEAQYADRTELISRGRVVKYSPLRVLIKNQGGDLVDIPLSPQTHKIGFSGSLIPGEIVVVFQIAGEAEADRIINLSS